MEAWTVPPYVVYTKDEEGYINIDSLVIELSPKARALIGTCLKVDVYRGDLTGDVLVAQHAWSDLFASHTGIELGPIQFRYDKEDEGRLMRNKKFLVLQVLSKDESVVDAVFRVFVISKSASYNKSRLQRDATRVTEINQGVSREWLKKLSDVCGTKITIKREMLEEEPRPAKRRVTVPSETCPVSAPGTPEEPEAESPASESPSEVTEPRPSRVVLLPPELPTDVLPKETLLKESEKKRFEALLQKECKCGEAFYGKGATCTTCEFRLNETREEIKARKEKLEELEEVLENLLTTRAEELEKMNSLKAQKAKEIQQAMFEKKAVIEEEIARVASLVELLKNRPGNEERQVATG